MRCDFRPKSQSTADRRAKPSISVSFWSMLQGAAAKFGWFCPEAVGCGPYPVARSNIDTRRCLGDADRTRDDPKRNRTGQSFTRTLPVGPHRRRHAIQPPERTFLSEASLTPAPECMVVARLPAAAEGVDSEIAYAIIANALQLQYDTAVQ